MSHPHYSTGLPCDCSFTAHLDRPAVDGAGWERVARRIEADVIDDLAANRRLQSPAGQAFVKRLRGLHGEDPRLDALMPWLAREYRKGRLHDDWLERALETHPVGRALPDEVKDSLREYHIKGAPANLPGVDVAGLHHALEQPPADRRSPWYESEPNQFHELQPRELYHWGDFLRSDHPLAQRLDLNHHTIQEFHHRIQDWDRAMEEAAQHAKLEALQGGKVVHTTPEGYTVRQLTTPEELKAEGDAMGHCVGGYHGLVASGDSLIYSLRDPKGQPHVTTEITPRWRLPNGQDVSPDNLSTLHPSETEGAVPVPHRGEVVQIQGKANRDPEDKYKAQMADWFRSFPPEERPRGADPGDDGITDDEGYYHSSLDHPDLIPAHEREHGTLANRTEPTEDAYGLLRPPSNIDADYDSLLDNVKHHDYGSQGGVYDTDHIDDIYRLAKERGEIPQLGQAAENWQQHHQDKFDEWQDMNYQYMPHYPEEPTGWVDHEGEDVDEAHPEATPYWQVMPLDYRPERHFDQAAAEKEYDEAMGDLQREDPGLSAASRLYNHLNQHQEQLVQETPEGPETYQYMNELKPPAPATQPQAFSKVASDEPDLHSLPHHPWDTAFQDSLRQPSRYEYRYRSSDPDWGNFKRHRYDVIHAGAPAQHAITDEWGKTKTYGYDPELADPANDRFGTNFKLRPHPEWRPEAYRTDDGDVRGFREETPAQEGMLYRGLSHEEFEQAKQRGYFESDRSYNIANEPGTMYSTEPSQAASYASGFAPWHRKPGFNHPSYVIAVPRPHDTFPNPGFASDPSNTEMVVPGQVPFDQVQQAWQFRPYAAQNSDMDVRTEDFGKTWSGRPNTGFQQVAYRPYPLPLGHQAHIASTSLYKRWVFSPTSGEVHIEDNSGDPLDVKYHTDLAREINEPGLVHGFAYKIGGGWRLTDWESRPLTDHYVIASVMRALTGAESPPESAGDDWAGMDDAAPDNWQRVHHGAPS